jgi:predicted O-methyltransferase YrrM
MMLLRKLGRRIATHSAARKKERFSRFNPRYAIRLTFREAASQFPTRNSLYAYLHHYYFHYLPLPLREHREYFAREGRGFGEEAFHAMWYLLLKDFQPRQMLEIGVFRGQVISLWSLINRIENIQSSIHCISPFTAAGDTVSDYPNLDFLYDVESNFKHFDLPMAACVKALSTDVVATTYLQSHRFDCIYIDGSHDYDVVLSDYRHCVAALETGSLLIMDDASLYTDFTPPPFSFAGHPGPSKIAREFADRELKLLAGIGHQNIYLKQ